MEHYQEALASGRGVICITAHLGSWELMPYVQSLWGWPLSFLVRAADNPLIENHLRQVREAHGNRALAKRDGLRECYRVLAAGQALGILIDQAVTPALGVPGTFLGLPVHTTPIVAQLAL